MMFLEVGGTPVYQSAILDVINNKRKSIFL